MIISSKGTYAIRALIDMAQNNGKDKYICLSNISSRLNVSRKYLESIMTLLAKNNLVDVALGKCGGYKLNRDLKDYSLFDILSITEEEMKTTACSCINSNDQCQEKSSCTVYDTYNELHNLIIDYLKNKTLEDLIRKQNCHL